MKKVILEIFKEQRKILEVLKDFDHNKTRVFEDGF